MERLSMLGSSRAIVGEPAPRISCKAIIDGRIKEFSSRKVMSDDQWLILIFFPMAWSFICPTEIQGFAARLADFSARSCAVVFASTDSEHVLKAWNATPAEEGGLGSVATPLLSDRSHRIARDYGVLVEEEGVAQRAVFVVDPKGIVRASAVNDVNIGRDVGEVLRTVDALRFSDEYGQGCPVDWRAGQAGIALSDDSPFHRGTHSNRSSMGAANPSSTNANSGANLHGNLNSLGNINASGNSNAPGNMSAAGNSHVTGTVSTSSNGRPPVNRGLSWTAAAWAKNAAASARPRSWIAPGNGVPPAPGSGISGGSPGESPQLTPGGRARVPAFWAGGPAGNEEAVASNGVAYF